MTGQRRRRLGQACLGSGFGLGFNRDIGRRDHFDRCRTSSIATAVAAATIAATSIAAATGFFGCPAVLTFFALVRVLLELVHVLDLGTLRWAETIPGEMYARDANRLALNFPAIVLDTFLINRQLTVVVA